MTDHGPGAGSVDAPSRPAPRSTVATRDRILAAASELFADRGVRGVGVDAIVTKAGVAKASFYHHFASKDDLIDAWLRSDAARWIDRVVATAEQHASDPQARLRAFFAALAEMIDGGGFAGCPFLNVAAELRAPDEPARPVIPEFVAEVKSQLRRLVADAGLREPDAVADELQLLVAGAMSLRVAGPNPVGQALQAAADAVISARS